MSAKVILSCVCRVLKRLSICGETCGSRRRRAFASDNSRPSAQEERTPGVRYCRAYRSLHDSCLQTLGTPQWCEAELSAKDNARIVRLRQQEGRSDYLFTVRRLILLALVSVLLPSAWQKGRTPLLLDAQLSEFRDKDPEVLPSAVPFGGYVSSFNIQYEVVAGIVRKRMPSVAQIEKRGPPCSDRRFPQLSMPQSR